MRAPGFAPPNLATRSLCKPAQLIIHRAVKVPFDVSRTPLLPFAWRPTTFVRNRNSPPRAPINSVNVLQTAAKSTIPVEGTWSPARQLTCGSISFTSEALSLFTDNPFANPRPYRLLRRGSSDSDVATITLPHASYRMP